MADAITVYGTTWCGDCRRSKAYLDERGTPYAWIDIEQAPELIDYINELNDGYNIVPTIVFPDGSFLAEPTNDELAAKLDAMAPAAGE